MERVKNGVNSNLASEKGKEKLSKERNEVKLTTRN